MCKNCIKHKAECDYSLKLSWGGRPYKKPRIEGSTFTVVSSTRNSPDLQDVIPESDSILDYEEAEADMGSVKPAFNNIAKIFKPSPLQEEVNDESFIMETPSVHYLPTYKPRIKSAKPAPVVKPKQKPQPEPEPESEPEMEPEPEPEPELEPILKIEMEDQDQSFLALSEIPFGNFPLDMDLYDFSKDFTQSEELALGGSSYHTALMQIPLRNQVYDDHVFDLERVDETEDIIAIPRPLDTFPDILKEVPLYRDLFHHFIHVTADLLVPAPTLYPQNPFRTLLPSMALSTPHLLDLILAYSATHRARFLSQETPVHIISRLLGRVFDGLTRSLENGREAQSDATLTTAIMLSSYEILTGAADASWKKHLHGARDIVMARGLAQPFMGGQDSHSVHDMISALSPGFDESKVLGPKSLSIARTGNASETDVSYFLVRWFAYIDVIAGLSSPKASALMTANENMAQLWALHDWSLARLKEKGIEEILGSHLPGTWSLDSLPVKIDFLLGMDLDMLPVFSKVTHLARQRRLLRAQENMSDTFLALPHSSSSISAATREFQALSSEALELADLIISFCDAYEMRRREYVNNAVADVVAKNLRGSVSSLSSDEEISIPPTLEQLPVQVQTYSQLCVLNTTFCYSALIQLYRRVLDLPTRHSLVQGVVQRMTELFDLHIPLGSPVESCMSFPIFATACEVIDPVERKKFWVRMKRMERFGVGHVGLATATVELVWKKNVSWVDIMEQNGWEIVLA